MLVGIERLAEQGRPVQPEMRAAYERQTGRKLPITQLPIEAVKVTAVACESTEAPEPVSVAAVASRGNAKPCAGKTTTKPDKGLFTGIPDDELNTFAAATDGMEAAGGLAVIVGLRRALRAAFRRCASAAPYGPAVLVRSDIANLSFCSLSTVKRWLPMIERAGIVRIERAKKATGENHPSIYTMLFPVGELGEKKKIAPLAHNEPRGGFTMNKGVGSRPQNVPRATSEETIETVETIDTSSPAAGGQLFQNEASTITASKASLRPRNPLFDALALATDGDPAQLTADTSRAVGVALSKIKKVTPELTDDEINRRAGNYRDHFRDAALTAPALAKHWARCAQPKNGASALAASTDWTRNPLNR